MIHENKSKLDLKKQLRLFKIMMSFTKDWRADYYITMLILIVIEMFLFMIWMPATIGQIIDKLSSSDIRQFYIWILIRLASVSIGMLFLIKMRTRNRNINEKINCKVKQTLFAHMINLPIYFYEDTHTGDFLSRLTVDVKTASNVYSRSFNNLCYFVLGLITASIYLIIISYHVFLLAVGLGVITLIVQTLYAKYILKYSREIQQSIGIATRLFTDIVTGIKVIRMFLLQKYTDGQVLRQYAEIRDIELQRVKKDMVRNFIMTIMNALTIGATLIFLIIYTGRGEMSLVNMIIASSLSMEITSLIGNFGDQFVEYQRAFAGAERVVEILDMQEEKIDNESEKKDIKHDIDNKVAISFSNLQFSYNRTNTVLNDFTAELEKGTSLAIVGKSGGGKSTLIKLLMGFYQPDAGEILIFGKNYKDYSMEELRRLISYVPQENYLFNGTIKENIQFSKTNATDEEVKKAAIAANAHDFIVELEDGYDTIVGERGNMLSGGQRQRVAIARALLKNAPILLLDEATASLDSEAEREVQLAIDRLMQDRSTIIIIAHRLATIENADKIIVLEDGNIQEAGSHNDLLIQNNRYAYYYNIQFKIPNGEIE